MHTHMHIHTHTLTHSYGSYGELSPPPSTMTTATMTTMLCCRRCRHRSRRDKMFTFHSSVIITATVSHSIDVTTKRDGDARRRGRTDVLEGGRPPRPPSWRPCRTLSDPPARRVVPRISSEIHSPIYLAPSLAQQTTHQARDSGFRESTEKKSICSRAPLSTLAHKRQENFKKKLKKEQDNNLRRGFEPLSRRACMACCSNIALQRGRVHKRRGVSDFAIPR